MVSGVFVVNNHVKCGPNDEGNNTATGSSLFNSDNDRENTCSMCLVMSSMFPEWSLAQRAPVAPQAANMDHLTRIHADLYSSPRPAVCLQTLLVRVCSVCSPRPEDSSVPSSSSSSHVSPVKSVPRSRCWNVRFLRRGAAVNVPKTSAAGCRWRSRAHSYAHIPHSHQALWIIYSQRSTSVIICWRKLPVNDTLVIPWLKGLQTRREMRAPRTPFAELNLLLFSSDERGL